MFESTPEKIKSKEDLLEEVSFLHSDAYRLCKGVFGEYFSNAGNIGIFCHSQDEYELLTEVKEDLTKPDDNENRKYFKLKEPIFIQGDEDTPDAEYSYLYIRKPDPTPYGDHAGDIDFYVDSEEFEKLLEEVKEGHIENAKVYYQEGIGDMIELSDSKDGVLAYVSTKEITEKIRFKVNQF